MQWYYERDGQQVGPVSQTEMVRLIVHRRIRPQTLVWHPGFGDEWRPASKAGLVAPSSSVRIMLTRGGTSSTPAVATGEQGNVSSMWAWLMLVPGLVDLFLLVAGQQTRWAVTPGRPVTGICIYAILFLTLMKDRQTLSRAGVRPPSFWWWLFLPGYFWCRRKVLRRGSALFAACLFLGFVEAATLLSSPPPGFEPFLLSQKQKPAAAPHEMPDGPKKEAPRQQDHAGAGDPSSSSEEQIQL
ncbi:DUF4339 domain-containing protein [Bombella mellum]|uniref:GYF domain-containing protein n=1 Tax=Bombella mellum TaxID=2039288 RepID=A0ABR5ZTS2_9PROT|nr:DUF4339 domain-containing protein [Bombella mellum]MBA5727584.1 hypothetical protein [Bombella mellum]